MIERLGKLRRYFAGIGREGFAFAPQEISAPASALFLAPKGNAVTDFEIAVRRVGQVRLPDAGPP
jgi:hypothetical protein